MIMLSFWLKPTIIWLFFPSNLKTTNYLFYVKLPNFVLNFGFIQASKISDDTEMEVDNPPTDIPEDKADTYKVKKPKR